MVSAKDKALSTLSICAKAGKVVSGGFMTERSLQDGSACLVIVSEDASENTKKKFENKSKFYKVPFAIFGLSEELGKHMGKEKRTSLAVTDPGLAKSIISNLDNV